MRSFPVTLRLAFLVFLVALVFSQAGLFFYRQMEIAGRRTMEEAAASSIHEGTRIAQVIEYAFLAGKEDLAERMISHESAEASTTLVLLAGEDGTALYSSQYDLKGRPLAAVRPDIAQLAADCRNAGLQRMKTDAERGLILSAFPVALGIGEEPLGKRPLGVLVIEKDLSRQKSAMRREAMAEFGLVAGSAALLAFLLWLPLALLINTRMRRLTAAARELEKGNYAARAGLTGNDEMAQLGHAFDKMAATIQRSAGELARSNTDLKRFAYVASHDLREPLRTVGSFLKLLERSHAQQLDKQGREYLAYAVGGAARLDRLINNILLYSSVTTKGKELSPTESAGALEEALGNLRQSIEESGAVIEKGGMPRVLADEGQLAMLFQNLIANALKFHGPETPRIAVNSACSGGLCTFQVRDNGIGIDPAHHQQVFEMFKRLHPQSEYPGTGIGLAICKRIVERHGGEIWVESREGEGTTFCFTLRTPEAPQEAFERSFRSP